VGLDILEVLGLVEEVGLDILEVLGLVEVIVVCSISAAACQFEVVAQLLLSGSIDIFQFSILVKVCCISISQDHKIFSATVHLATVYFTQYFQYFLKNVQYSNFIYP